MSTEKRDRRRVRPPPSATPRQTSPDTKSCRLAQYKETPPTFSRTPLLLFSPPTLHLYSPTLTLYLLPSPLFPLPPPHYPPPLPVPPSHPFPSLIPVSLSLTVPTVLCPFSPSSPLACCPPTTLPPPLPLYTPQSMSPFFSPSIFHRLLFPWDAARKTVCGVFSDSPSFGWPGPLKAQLAPQLSPLYLFFLPPLRFCALVCNHRLSRALRRVSPASFFPVPVCPCSYHGS